MHVERIVFQDMFYVNFEQFHFNSSLLYLLLIEQVADISSCTIKALKALGSRFVLSAGWENGPEWGFKTV